MKQQYLKKIAEDYGEYSRKAFEAKTRTGMFCFYSNFKWEIETCFHYLKNTVRLGICHQHTK